MAARVPVVVSDVGGLREVVQNHETGIVVYPGDLDSLIWGVVHTLAWPDWAALRAENAYRTVRQRYNWDTIARSTVEVYRQVVAERRQTDW